MYYEFSFQLLQGELQTRRGRNTYKRFANITEINISEYCWVFICKAACAKVQFGHNRFYMLGLYHSQGLPRPTFALAVVISNIISSFQAQVCLFVQQCQSTPNPSNL